MVRGKCWLAVGLMALSAMVLAGCSGAVPRPGADPSVSAANTPLSFGAGDESGRRVFKAGAPSNAPPATQPGFAAVDMRD